MYTLEETKDLLREIIRDNPDALNPTDSTSSLCYYKLETEDGEKHCIAGELLYKIGAPLPETNGIFTSEYLYMGYDKFFDRDTADYIRRVQKEADALTTSLGAPWSRLISKFPELAT